MLVGIILATFDVTFYVDALNIVITISLLYWPQGYIAITIRVKLPRSLKMADVFWFKWTSFAQPLMSATNGCIWVVE